MTLPSVSLILMVASLVITILAGMGKAPLWVALLLTDVAIMIGMR